MTIPRIDIVIINIPETAPPLNAIVRASFMLLFAPEAVLIFALIAIHIPINNPLLFIALSSIGLYVVFLLALYNCGHYHWNGFRNLFIQSIADLKSNCPECIALE